MLKRYPIFVALALLYFAFTLARFDTFQTGTFMDDAHYVVLSEAISEGQGARLINFPDVPFERQYPAGWPLLLSPATAVFNDELFGLQFTSLLLGVMAIALTYRLFHNRLSSPYLEIGLTFFALHFDFIGASAMVMSETAFLFLTTLSLLLLSRSSQRIDPALILGVLAAILAGLTRSIGYALWIAIVLTLLAQRRWKEGIFAGLAFGLGFLPQFLLNLQGGGLITSPVYTDVFSFTGSTLFFHIPRNIFNYLSPSLFARSMMPAGFVFSFVERMGLGILILLGALPIFLLTLLGWGLSIRLLKFVDIYLLCYFGALFVIWPKPDANPRHIIPILNFLLMYLMMGLRALLETKRLRQFKRLRSGLLAAIMAGFIMLTTVSHSQELRSPTRSRITDISIGSAWIRENAPPDARVMATMPVEYYLYARRQTLNYPYESTQPNAILAAIERQGVDYVILAPPLKVGPPTEWESYVADHLFPAIEAYADQFALVYENPDHNVRVYEKR